MGRWETCGALLLGISTGEAASGPGFRESGRGARIEFNFAVSTSPEEKASDETRPVCTFHNSLTSGYAMEFCCFLVLGEVKRFEEVG